MEPSASRPSAGWIESFGVILRLQQSLVRLEVEHQGESSALVRIQHHLLGEVVVTDMRHDLAEQHHCEAILAVEVPIDVFHSVAVSIVLRSVELSTTGGLSHSSSCRRLTCRTPRWKMPASCCVAGLISPRESMTGKVSPF